MCCLYLRGFQVLVLLQSTYCSPSTAVHLLHPTYCSPPSAAYLLQAAYCKPFTAGHLLQATYCKEVATMIARHRSALMWRAYASGGDDGRPKRPAHLATLCN